MATIKVQQIKSRIGAPKNQKRTLDAMGLRKLHHTENRHTNAHGRRREHRGNGKELCGQQPHVHLIHQLRQVSESPSDIQGG